MKKIETNKQFEFEIFCIEMYAKKKNMSGRDVNKLFTKTGVDKYLFDCYDALHTQGFGYICAEIDSFIDTKIENDKH